MFRDSQIVIITIFVAVSSVGIKRVVCILFIFPWKHVGTHQKRLTKALESPRPF